MCEGGGGRGGGDAITDLGKRDRDEIPDLKRLSETEIGYGWETVNDNQRGG